MFNTFGADWRINASYVQMHTVQNVSFNQMCQVRMDVYKRQGDKFVCNKIFQKCSSYQDTIMLKISYKFTKNFLSYEVW